MRWHKLGEVESEYTAEKLVLFAICVPKIFAIGRNLTKFCQKISLHSFFETRCTLWVFSCFLCNSAGPSRATAGPGKHYRGALSPLPHSVGLCLEIETPKAKRGERCPLTIRLGVRGSVVNSHSGPKMDFLHILGQKEAICNTISLHFQYFWATAGPPNVTGPGKTSPLSPSRRASNSVTNISLLSLMAMLYVNYTPIWPWTACSHHTCSCW